MSKLSQQYREQKQSETAGQKDYAKTIKHLEKLRDDIIRDMKAGKNENYATKERLAEIRQKISKEKRFQKQAAAPKKRTSAPAPSKFKKISSDEVSKRPKWDKVSDIKKYALKLTTETDKKEQDVLVNTIADMYDSLSATERKNFDIGQYVAKNHLVKMAKTYPSVEKYTKSQTSLLTPSEVKHNFAKDAKVAKSKGKKPLAPKEPEKPAAGKENKRYTKRGVTQMLKQLREAQEKGRKDSAAYKTRDADIKRLTKVLKTLSSMDDVVTSVSAQYRITLIASTLEETASPTVWGTSATYKELEKGLRGLGIKGVTAKGLEGDFDGGDGVTKGSAPLYEYFDKVLGEDDSMTLAEGNGALVFAALYIAGLLDKSELKTLIPSQHLRKLAIKAKG